MGIKVSVIVPVYNAAAYLAPCIESLLNQTLQECEFIFVDDGSKDGSASCIESYQRNDSRIRLIRQDNQGVSAARNAGLSEAAGEYIGFVDADDYIERDMYEVLYRAAKRHDSDVVISGFESEMDGRRFETRYPFPVGETLDQAYIERQILLYFLQSENLNAVWNKLYRHRTVRENRIQFPYGVALGEDELFNLHFFSRARTALYTDYSGYHYKETMGSATRNIMEKDYFKRALEVYQSKLPDTFAGKVGRKQIDEYKSLRLIRNVMSYIYIYLMPSSEISFRRRYRYVKKMVRHSAVREALQVYYREQYASVGRYEKLVTDLIRSRFVFGLYCAASYSRYRNKTTGGVHL